jgi:PAS domain S-box-containing protein
MYEHAAVGIEQVAPDGRLLMVNAALCRMLGYGRTELLSKTFDEIVHPDDRAREATLLKKMLAGEYKCYDIEKRYLHRNGSLVWAAVTSSVVRDGAGSALYCMCVVRDITERKLANANFRFAVESAPTAMVMVGEDGKILLVNAHTEKLFGYRSEELLQQPVEILVPESSRRSHPGLRSEFFLHPEERPMGRGRDVYGRRKDGTQFSVEIGLNSIQGENGIWVLASIVDISERKQALRESEDKLALLLESTAEGIFGIDLEARFTFCNPACLLMLGYQDGHELIGKNVHTTIHHTRPDGTPYPPEECPILKSLDSGQRAGIPDEVLWRADGTSFQAEYWSSPQLRDGQVVGAVVAFINITARKRAEEALKKSEEKFSKAFRQSPMSLTITSAKDHRYIDVNETYERITGWRREEIIGRTPLDIGLYVDPSERLELVNRALTKGGFRNQEVRFRMRDGSIRIALMSGELIELDGEPCLLNVGADVTEYKHVQEALKKSEEKFSKAFRESPMALTLTRAKDHRYIDVNETFERLTGYSREEALGRTPFDLKIWVDPSQRLEFVRRLQAEGSIRDLEVVFRRKEGSIGVGLGSAELIEIDGDQFILSAIADITERKQAERDLKESEEKFRTVFRSAPAGMVMVSPEGRFLAVNEAFCEFLGYSESELLTKDLLSVTHPEDRAISLLALDQRRSNEFGSQGFEKRYLHKNGQLQWGEVSPILIRDSAGKPEYFVTQVVNITERKQAEEALRESEERYRHLVESSNDWVWEVDAEGVYTYAGPQCRKILGYEPAEIVGRTPFDLMPPEEARRVGAIFSTIAAERKAFRRLENINLHKDGHLVVLETNGVPVIDEGRFRGYRGMDRDVTERKRVEEELRRREAELREAQRLAQLGSWLWDFKNKTVTWSEQLYRIHGRDPSLPPPSYEELPQLFTQESWSRLNAAFGEARLTGVVADLDLELVRPDGSKLWIATCGEAVRDAHGVVVQLRGTVQDITERKRAEQDLRESEERFRLISNAAPVLIWMSGPDKLCNYFNRPWLEFTGRSLEAELGNGWTEGVHPDDLPKCLETYTQSFDRRVPFSMEYRLRRHDGEYRWIHDTGVPRVNPDGSFAGYIGSGIDVTDRRRGEEALRTVSGKLIEAQEKERKRIARELHDDINQRLAMLAIELQQLKNIPRLSGARLRGRTEELFKRTTEISSEVQLLSHRLHSSSLEYLGLVPAMKGFCGEFAKHQKVEVDFAHSNVPSPLPPDVALGLFRVFQEALRNAVKHSGVRKYEVRLLGAPGRIQLTIRDSGKGFDPEEAMSGQGLGLVSMRERINLLKGAIAIVSKPKCGTEITVSIPLAAETSASQHATA